MADSSNNALQVVSKGLGFPAAAIATATAVTHTIFLGLNQLATLSTPTISPAEIGIQQGSQGPIQSQEFTVGGVTGCTTDGVTVNPSVAQ